MAKLLRKAVKKSARFAGKGAVKGIKYLHNRKKKKEVQQIVVVLNINEMKKQSKKRK